MDANLRSLREKLGGDETKISDYFRDTLEDRHIHGVENMAESASFPRTTNVWQQEIDEIPNSTIMKSFFLAAFAATLALAPYVAAHGSVHKIVIDGKEYDGPAVGKGPLSGSPIRAISEVDPVKGATNPSLSCGQNASLADTTASANPGSQLQLFWINGQGGPWPHNAGPIINYMASCGGNDCSQFDASKAEWFKIEQSGVQSDGTWEQAALMQGQPFSLTLPENLKPGGYLLRNEIISLQLAMSSGGYESYPSCSQLLIGGNGNGVPDETVQFPGAYSDNDPGLLVNIYPLAGPYVFPGGPISNLASSAASGMTGGSNNTSSAGGGAGSASSAAPSAASSSAAKPSATASLASAPASASSPASTKTCGSKKRMAKRHIRHASH
ncbi:glycoside hydrolase family 61 protein [Phanerochaete carnosa HHB-10118-sp]|uniref:lytic cellulose monooxygenase (C4-dehydrogenating) n=1 Tax=Phanerochaete carnosa (strain HHB-10118-sp) TaxID=650164 RepID=K5VWY7_PHACS|nr:glycoside hydrolase family 61 protein [Phanerochaete carnosa HHB-10118-sp]EKM51119.1 glycoside hydrolase family 61 protein [Phanerochaete carnosa HHB-10118-sp]